jgi:Family of unknown function (DUF5996)
MTDAWPALPAAEWEPTRDTLHMWTQIVGKSALALAPPVNHWWGVTLRVSARGLASPLLPYRGRGVQFEFDFVRHVLAIDTTDGSRAEIALAPRSVADFYAEFRARLSELGLEIEIFPSPTEVTVAIPFAEDHVHASYDADAVRRFWTVLVSADRVMSQFRSRFLGKCSPVHFFWGGFDLAVTRFSGRTAPPHRGGVPNCPDWVQREAYSHEVSSAGYWPGAGGEGMFYSYAYAEPGGFKNASIEPAAAFYDGTMGEFMLPYSEVRAAGDPDATLMSFLQSTYEAAADLARWDRKALER